MQTSRMSVIFAVVKTLWKAFGGNVDSRVKREENLVFVTENPRNALPLEPRLTADGTTSGTR